MMATRRANITDRAHRYRAAKLSPTAGKRCLFCGSTRNLVPDHWDGHPDHTNPSNLETLCKACNTAKGSAFKAAGRGRLTNQYNPTRGGGASNVGEWMQAVGAITPHIDRGDRGLVSEMSTTAAVDMIRATPQSKRREFAARLRNPAKLERCVKDVKKRGGAVSPYGVCKSALSKRKSNPAQQSIEVFEDFHGHAPTEVVTITKKVHHHGNLAALGTLVSLDVWGVDEQGHKISGFKKALLCSNEDRNQLFIEGGDQAINLRDFGVTMAHEMETLGRVTEIAYRTNKTHLGDEGGDAVYIHKFRTTNDNGKHVTVKMSREPDLIYDVRNEQLLFSGGSYEVLREGIDK